MVISGCQFYTRFSANRIAVYCSDYYIKSLCWCHIYSLFVFKVPIPRFAVGIVIGRNGEMIKKIQSDAGVRIQFKPGLYFFFFKNLLALESDVSFLT